MNNYYNLTKIILLYSCFLLLYGCTNAPLSNKKLTTPLTQNDSSQCWNDLRLGELPPYNAYDALDSMLRKYNKLCYSRIEKYSCEPDALLEEQQRKYEAQNQQYFISMEIIYGKSWKQKFDEELEGLQDYLTKNNLHVKPNTITCNSLNGQEGIIRETCNYHGRKLFQAWQEYITEHGHNIPFMFVLKTPPDQSHSQKIDTTILNEHYVANINYHVKTNMSIIAELKYPDGIVTIRFIETTAGTDIATTYDLKYLHTK